VAAGVAVVLSPIAPLGPARSVYPSRGVDVDGTVVGVGTAALVVVLGVVGVVVAARAAPHRRLPGPVPSKYRTRRLARRPYVVGAMGREPELFFSARQRDLRQRQRRYGRCR
jgi:hypothetical protein